MASKMMRRPRLALAAAAPLLFSPAAEAFVPPARRAEAALAQVGIAAIQGDGAPFPMSGGDDPYSRRRRRRSGRHPRRNGNAARSIVPAVASMPPFDDVETSSSGGGSAAASAEMDGDDRRRDDDTILSPPAIRSSSPEPPSSPTLTPIPPTPPPPKKKSNFRMSLFSFLNLPPVEVLSALAVLGSSFLFVLDTLQSLPPLPPSTVDLLNLPTNDLHVLIHYTLEIVNVVFAVDFFVRWYAAGNFKLIYLTKPLVTLDIIVVLVPLFLGTLVPVLDGLGVVVGPPGSGGGGGGDAQQQLVLPAALQFGSAGLQNLLLLRILRLRRVLTDPTTFRRFEVACGIRRNDVRPYQLQLARVLLSVFTLLSVASGLIYTTEHEVNPAIPDYFAALYFGLTTLTTVGFGDIAPITPEGRLVVCTAILAGVAIIPAQAAELVDAIVEFQQDRKKGGPRVTVRAAKTATTPGGAAARTTKKELSDDGQVVVSSTLLRAAAGAQQRAEASGTAKESPAVVVAAAAAAAGEENSVSAAAPPSEKALVGSLGRCCLVCEATDHRVDASFCWSCGSRL